MTIQRCGWCKTKHDFCDSCGIGVGFKHKKETELEKVGDCLLCHYCLDEFNDKGKVEVRRFSNRYGCVITWLNKDLSVNQQKMKVI